jgi:hypothetical protein
MRKHHKEESLGWEISFKKSSVRGSSPGWKYTFAIDDKGGEISQMQDRELNAWRKRKRHGYKGEMVTAGA